MPSATAITPMAGTTHAKLAQLQHKQFWTIGNSALLNLPLLGLFCSVKCPGDAILKTYDLARSLRDAGVPVIGGFQSPLEKECLRLLLRGQQPIVICPARGIQQMRIPTPWQQALNDHRLLVLSPFAATQRRPTVILAEQRNRLVSSIATAVFVAYAEPGGKTAQLCTELIHHGKSVYTHPSTDNLDLLQLGAQPGDAKKMLREMQAASR